MEEVFIAVKQDQKIEVTANNATTGKESNTKDEI